MAKTKKPRKTRKTKTQPAAKKRPTAPIVLRGLVPEETQKSQKLSLMLASIEYKRRAGVPLAGKEQRLLECAAAELHERQNTKYDYSDPKLIRVQRSLDVEPIFDTLKRFRHVLKKDGMKSGRYLGSVDKYTAQNWARECGAAIGTPEYIEYSKKKLMSGEFSKFRMDWN